ncbi:MAG: hypothetical protein ABI569_13255, partial [Casimicrobiaceae bacterium]
MPEVREARRSTTRPPFNLKPLAAALGIGLGVGLATPARAVTFTVTNLNDAGLGSLRQAVLDSNAMAGADTIVFQTGVAGTIALAS